LLFLNYYICQNFQNSVEAALIIMAGSIIINAAVIATVVIIINVNKLASASSAANNSITTVHSLGGLPSYYPFSSKEDFFTHGRIDKQNATLLGETHCESKSANEHVHLVQDSAGNDRCFTTIHPTKGSPSSDRPMPVVFFAHGSGGSAGNCGFPRDLGGGRWTDLVEKYGFVLLCGEALQYSVSNPETGATLSGGLWEIPEIFTNITGPKCSVSDSFDNGYMRSVFDKLAEQPEIFDTSRVFVTGCSMGSAFTLWQAQCLREEITTNITSFATHSTGLKIKGDGLRFPGDFYNSQYRWGECPGCEFWPAAVQHLPGLKACIFDNTGDPNVAHPFFYNSSIQLAKAWASAGNRVAETHFGSGGHCQIHSHEDIAKCLDDGTGRLIPFTNI
jgi:hypothetical protein